jgi:two-component system cell cycle sensor histidine kinase/response regulator CckA
MASRVFHSFRPVVSRRLRALVFPSFANDRSDGWVSRSVHVVSLGLAAGLGVALLEGLVSAHVRPHVLLALGAELVLVAFAFWLNRRGTPRGAAQLLAASQPLLALALMLGSGQGFRDVACLIMPASLIFCGFLLDRRSLAAITLLTAAATAVVLLAEREGLVGGPGLRVSYYQDIADATIIIVITGVGVGLVGGQLRESHERLERQEQALRSSEGRYRGLVDLAVDAILVAHPAQGVTEANRRALELAGYSPEELRGRPLEALFSAAELARVPCRYDLLDRGETVVRERLLTRRDGVSVPVEMSTKRMPDGAYQTIIRDVGERHRAEAERFALEARLRQAQKMEAVGRLAGGIAHDFNNLLSAITGSLTLALRDVPEGARAHRWLTEIDRSAWRAAALTRHLLAFSRQQVIAPKVLDLRSVVEGTGSMLARMIGEDITLRTRLPAEPCRVEVDPGQMEQIILNLGANARDAMPDGGSLTLELGWSPPRPGPAGAPGGGARVVLSVSDTGHGMSDDVKARIFEPFFTTKPTGSGTGLGLAMVYGAVQQNGGWIDVRSRPGRGTTFRIFLPEAGAEAPLAADGAEEEAARGTETVLLVEDEAAVREVARAQLEALGYRVLACASAEEALAVAAGHCGPLHLLLTDVVMPGMNGRDLAQRLRTARPGVKVLFSSGYGEDVVARHGVLEAGVFLLEKPYSLPTLARQVRQALA